MIMIKALIALPLLVTLSVGCNAAIFPIIKSNVVEYKDGLLTWIAPTQRTDKEPIDDTNVKKYLIFYGPKDSIDAAIEIPTDDNSTSWLLLGLLPGEYELAMVTIDTGGRQSQLSEIYSFSVIIFGAPNPPTGINVVTSVAAEVD